MKDWQLIALLILVSAVALTAAQQDTQSHGRKKPTTSEWTDLQTSMDKMHMSMTATKPSGDSDVDFARLMLPHHQAAIDMAKAQLSYGTDPQMRRLAQEIITDQQSEIELMQLWLKQRESGTSNLKPTPDQPARKDQ